jgi:uncharacterized membrane protein YtjA (UPF0391 family)
VCGAASRGGFDRKDAHGTALPCTARETDRAAVEHHHEFGEADSDRGVPRDQQNDEVARTAADSVAGAAATRERGLKANDLVVETGFGINTQEDGLQKGGSMLRYALAFFVIALIAGVFGFLGIAAAAAGIAKILFFIFLVLFLVSLVSGLLTRASN